MNDNPRSRIVVLAECFYPHLGGGSLSQWKFTQKAVEEGYDVTVFTPRFDDDPKEEMVEGVEIRRPFPGPNNQDDLSSFSAMVRRIAFNLFLLPYLLVYAYRTQPAVLYSPSHLLHPVAKIIGTIYRIPVIQFIGYSPSLRDQEETDIQLLLEQMNFRFFMGDVVFTRNQLIADQVSEQNPQSSVDTIDGVLDAEKLREAISELDRSELRAELGIPEDKKTLCWVGRVVEIKNPEAVLEVLDQLPEEYHLVFVGDGPEYKPVKKSARSDHDFDRIHFTGKVSHKRALQIIGFSDGLILTSNTEAYPTVVFEALCLNTPVYATPVGVLPNLSDEMVYICNINNMSAIIEENKWRNGKLINEKKINRYSIEQFSDTVLKAILEGTE